LILLPGCSLHLQKVRDIDWVTSKRIDFVILGIFSLWIGLEVITHLQVAVGGVLIELQLSL